MYWKEIKKEEGKKKCCHNILRETYISEDCQHSVGRFDKVIFFLPYKSLGAY